MASDRNIRRVLNMKQDSVHVDDRASINGLSEGQISFSKSNNKQLAVTRKRNGKIWKSYMSHNGDQYVDRDIHVARRGYFENAVGIGTKNTPKALVVNGGVEFQDGFGNALFQYDKGDLGSDFDNNLRIGDVDNVNAGNYIDFDLVNDDIFLISSSVHVSDYLRHNGDSNTYIRFQDDSITIRAGGEDLITLTESTQDVVKLGDGGDVDINLNDDVFVEGSSGNVGIGTTSPSNYAWATNIQSVIYSSGNVGLSIATGDTTANSVIAFADGTSSTARYMGYIDYDHNVDSMAFRTSAVARLTIASDGTFTGSSSADISDERLKENIVTIPNALDSINQLQGRTFTWKEEANMQDGTRYGLIAQELESVFPDLVVEHTGIRTVNEPVKAQAETYYTDGDEIPDGKQIGDIKTESIEEVNPIYYKSINMSGIIPVLIEAVKELSAKVEALEG